MTDGSFDSSSVDRIRRSIGFFNFCTAFGKGFSVVDKCNFFFGVGAKSLSDEALFVSLRFTAMFIDLSLPVDTASDLFDFEVSDGFTDFELVLEDILDATFVGDAEVFEVDIALEETFLSDLDLMGDPNGELGTETAFEVDGLADLEADRTGLSFLVF